MCINNKVHKSFPSLETHLLYSTLKGHENSRFHVVSRWNTRDVFVGFIINFSAYHKIALLDGTMKSCL